MSWLTIERMDEIAATQTEAEKGGSAPGCWDWCAANGIDEEAMDALFEASKIQFANRLGAGDRPSDAFTSMIGQAFRLGWACANARELTS